MITTDPYYDLDMYNHFLLALKNNNIDFNEYIMIRPPYYFCLDIKEPEIINYDKIDFNNLKYIVTKVKPNIAQFEYLCYRRKGRGNASSLYYASNEIHNDFEKTKFGAFLNIKNESEIKDLSRKYGKIYWLGKYYNNLYKIAFSANKNILYSGVDVLVKTTTNIFYAEAELNTRIFKRIDFLKKYYQTPYYKDGIYFRPLGTYSPLI